jgi:hypothetical protein
MWSVVVGAVAELVALKKDRGAYTIGVALQGAARNLVDSETLWSYYLIIVGSGSHCIAICSGGVK